MKKTYIPAIIAASLFAFSFTGCSILLDAWLNGATGQTTKTDPDHIDIEYSEEVITFSKGLKFKKLEYFFGNTKNIDQSQNLYSIQVNNAKDTRYETGYIIPSSSSRSVETEDVKAQEIKFDFTGGRRENKVPDFVSKFNPDLITSSSGARAAGYGYSDSSSTAVNEVYEIDSKSSFYVSNNLKDEVGKDSKTATLMAKGKHCLVYIADEDIKKINLSSDSVTYEDTNFNFTKTHCKTLADNFDSYYEKVCAVMGNDDLSTHNISNIVKIERDEDNDADKLVIFINDISNDKIGNIMGYFWSRDLFLRSSENNTYTKTSVSYSNERKMIYLDAYYFQVDLIKSDSKYADSTIIHEFTHLLNFVNKRIIQGANYYETWFTEMLAMTSEDIFMDDMNISAGNSSSVFDARLPYFNFTYPYGFSSEIWGKSDDKSLLSAYSNTYTFGAYLLRNFGGLKLINQIATNAYVNEEAINKALTYCNTKEDFSSVLAKEGQILLNFNSKTDSSGSYITLNCGFTDQIDYEYKTGSSKTTYSYKIKSVDLSKCYITDDDGKKYTGPQLMDTNYQYSLGGWGFEVKDFGSVRNNQTFKAQLPTTKSVDLYVYFN